MRSGKGEVSFNRWFQTPRGWEDGRTKGKAKGPGNLAEELRQVRDCSPGDDQNLGRPPVRPMGKGAFSRGRDTRGLHGGEGLKGVLLDPQNKKRSLHKAAEEKREPEGINDDQATEKVEKKLGL